MGQPSAVLKTKLRRGGRPSKLTRADAAAIRALRAAGGHSHSRLAGMFGVWQSTVTRLLSGEHKNFRNA